MALIKESLCQHDDLSLARQVNRQHLQSTTAILNKLRQNLSDLEKDELREELKQEISTALEAGGISPTVTHSFMMVFVSVLIRNTQLIRAEPGESIVLYLKCLTLESLLMVKEMILSGLLLRLLSEAIKHFIQSRPRVQLIVQREDFNMCLSYFTSAAGNLSLSSFYLTVCCVTTN